MKTQSTHKIIVLSFIIFLIFLSFGLGFLYLQSRNTIGILQNNINLLQPGLQLKLKSANQSLQTNNDSNTDKVTDFERNLMLIQHVYNNAGLNSYDYTKLKSDLIILTDMIDGFNLSLDPTYANKYYGFKTTKGDGFLGSAWQVSFSPLNKYLLLETSKNRLNIYSLSKSDLTQISSKESSNDFSFSFSSDEHYLTITKLITNPDPNTDIMHSNIFNLSVIELPSGNELVTDKFLQITGGGDEHLPIPFAPVWSPDNKNILVFNSGNNTFQIYNLSGSLLKEVPGDYPYSYKWNSDGSKIEYTKLLNYTTDKKWYELAVN